jgi:FkbM family methyltransferase
MTMQRLLALLRTVRDCVPGLDVVHRALRQPYYRLLERLFPRGVLANLASGDAVRLHPRLLGIRPEGYEARLVGLLATEVKPGATVLDIGAHVGLHALMFSRRVGAGGRVIAVEASPANVGLCRKHFEWNDCHNVQLVEAAVADHEGEVAVTYRPDPTDPGAFANSLAYDIGGETATIPMTTIDRLCVGHRPDVIKIDIEGAELLALRGAYETLRRSGSVLVIAIHPDPMRALGTSPADLLAFLEGCGYEARRLDGNPAIDPGFEEIVFRRAESRHIKSPARTPP